MHLHLYLSALDGHKKEKCFKSHCYKTNTSVYFKQTRQINYVVSFNVFKLV